MHGYDIYDDDDVLPTNLFYLPKYLHQSLFLILKFIPNSFKLIILTIICNKIIGKCLKIIPRNF